MLSLDNSEPLKWYKMAIHDDSEWRKAVARENSDFKLDGNLVFHNGKLFIPLSMHADILHNHHDSVISGHLGRACMLAFVQSDYSWPGMNMYVHNYVCVCNVCAHIKAPRHKPYGLLQPLDIPQQAMAVHINGLHRQAPELAQVRLNLGCVRLLDPCSTLHPMQGDDRCPWACVAFP